MEHDFELRSLRFLMTLGNSLSQMRHPRRILNLAVRGASDFFGAEAVCVLERVVGEPPRATFRLPRDADWDESSFSSSLGTRGLSLAKTRVIAPIIRRGKPDAALVVRREAPLSRSEQRVLKQLAQAVSRALEVTEKNRLAKVRSRIDRKLMDELRPVDLFYHILHGLRSLTRYDHSSTLFVYEEARGGFEVRAEQISFRKAKSRHIGRFLAVPETLRNALLEQHVFGFDRKENGWESWTSVDAEGIADWCEQGLDGEEPAAALIVAPLSIKGRPIGLLRIAASRAGSLGPYESELVRRFVPITSVAIYRAQRTESLKATVLESERKSAISNLARSVAHDVNNALGSSIPLLQQSLRDLQAGDFSKDEVAEDLRTALESTQFCRRIFAGMLNFAKSTHHRFKEGHLRRALERTVSVLKNSLDRRQIILDLELGHREESIPCPQADLEQLLFNLISNARDAMNEGGRLQIRSVDTRKGVSLMIQDDGAGITAADLPHVQEPFFTTKTDGHGLGLAICRSIVWEMRGKMKLESERDRGTRVELILPTLGETIARES